MADFTELDLRAMLNGATLFRPDFDPDRYEIETRHRDMAWEVVVEPDPIRSSLVVITAYQVERR